MWNPFRHPLHPMLVHFPLACWILGVAGDVMGRLAAWPSVGESSTLTALGCVFALPAMATGLLEFVRLGDEPKLLRRAYWHMGLVSLAWVLFACVLLARWNGEGWQFSPGTVDLLLSIAGLGTLGAGAWHGADLIYRHGVGVSTSTTKD